MPLAWEASGQDVQLKLTEYLQQVPKEKAAVPVHHSMYTQALKKVALTRLPELDTDHIGIMLEHETFPEYVDLAVDYFPKAGSFRGAENRGRKLLLPCAEVLTPKQIGIALDGVRENGQIWDAGGMPDILKEFFHKTERTLAETAHHWQELMIFLAGKKDKGYLSGEYDSFEELLTERGLWPIATSVS